MSTVFAFTQRNIVMNKEKMIVLLLICTGTVFLIINTANNTRDISTYTVSLTKAPHLKYICL